MEKLITIDPGLGRPTDEGLIEVRLRTEEEFFPPEDRILDERIDEPEGSFDNISRLIMKYGGIIYWRNRLNILKETFKYRYDHTYTGASYDIDFEAPTYAVGDLNGQDGWTAYDYGAGDGVDVQLENPYEGDQGIKFAATGRSSCIKTLDTEIDVYGYVNFYFFIDALVTDGNLRFTIANTSDSISRCNINSIRADDELHFYDGSDWHYVGTIEANTWNKLTAEVNPVTDKVRWKCNDGDFTAWHDPEHTISELARVDVFTDMTDSVQVYVDSIEHGEAAVLEDLNVLIAAGEEYGMQVGNNRDGILIAGAYHFKNYSVYLDALNSRTLKVHGNLDVDGLVGGRGRYAFLMMTP